MKNFSRYEGGYDDWFSSLSLSNYSKNNNDENNVMVDHDLSKKYYDVNLMKKGCEYLVGTHDFRFLSLLFIYFWELNGY